MTDPATILVVDDQESAREFLGRYLEDVGYRTLLADSVEAALRALQAESVDLVITDLRMPEIDGVEGLRRMRSIEPQLPVIVLTAFATVETAVQAMKLGAFDYVRKPFEAEEMEIIVARALEHRRLVEENKKLRAEVASRYRLENIIGKSSAMLKMFEMVRKVSPVDVPVLITGESGTGKDLVARAIHGQSRRAGQTFLSINCAAVPESLLESELFGHEKGAFSGAERARPGYFREADGGTLFLDEIGDMSLGQQAKLLRVLESGELIPVGAEHPVQVDVRLVAATNQNLDERVQAQEFRADLLFRIETVQIRLPPLRERREDIPLLVAYFLERTEVRPGQRAPRLGGAVMKLLLGYDWPGNVRELEHSIEHAVLVAEGDEIGVEDLPPRLRGDVGATAGRAFSTAEGTYRQAKQAFERAYLTDLLERTHGSVSAAARIAGIHRATLHEKLKRLGIGARE
jgi:two-component system response regulator HydG